VNSLFPPGGPLPFVLFRATHSVRGVLAATLAKRGLDVTPEEAITIMLIDKFQASTVSKLAESLGRDRTTITRLLDSLERKGYIQRTVTPKDRRSTTVGLTLQGTEFEKEMEEDAKLMVRELTEGIRPEELMIALSVLARVRETADRVRGQIMPQDADEAP
jgi:DNA-binding MarR family transcriptional regulator